MFDLQNRDTDREMLWNNQCFTDKRSCDASEVVRESGAFRSFKGRSLASPIRPEAASTSVFCHFETQWANVRV